MGFINTGSFAVPSETVNPGTISVAWTLNGAKTATDTGSAALTGDATGIISYSRRKLELQLQEIPAKGTQFTIDWDRIGDGGGRSGTPTEVLTPTVISGSVSGTLATTDIVPGSLTASWSVNRKSVSRSFGSWNKTVWLVDNPHSRKCICNAAGDLLDADSGAVIGSINFGTGAYSLTVEQSYQHQTINTSSNSGGDYKGTIGVGETTEQEAFIGDLTMTYEVVGAGVEIPATKVYTMNELSFVISTSADYWAIAEGSVLFDFAGKSHYDIEGVIYTDFSTVTGAGTAVGSIDYATKVVKLTTWAESLTGSVVVKSLLLQKGDRTTATIAFRAPGRPLRPSSVQITALRRDTGSLITATSDADGLFDTSEVTGEVDYETGVIKARFKNGSTDIPVWLGSIRYNAVTQSFLPLDSSLVGINPVRLPSDGRVPIFRDGEVAVMHHTAQTDIGTPTDGQVFNLARTNQAEIYVTDANDVELAQGQYSVDLSAGTVTMEDPISLEDSGALALTPPLKIVDRIEHMSIVTDTQLSGALSLMSPIAHDYPADETIVSSAVLWGDLQARVFSEFTQKTWANIFSDSRIGDDSTGKYNFTDSPILVANNGSISERWAIVFSTTTTFSVIGETIGVIATGSTSLDLAPVNPVRGVPYFTIYAGGWGSGWSTANVVRFNTVGALAPLWMARTVIAGAATEDDDSFAVQIRGDAD